MNGIDLSTASDIRLGGTTVSAVYLGSNLIWPATHNYANDYFTIVTPIDNNTFRFLIPDNTSTQVIYYSLDNGTTWNEYLIKYDQTVYITLNINDLLMLKGSIDRNVQIESTKVYRAFGNLHSLFYGDNFKNNNNLPTNFFEPSLFTGSKIISAEDLIMPATTLSRACYNAMFRGCTNLVNGPILSAVTLTDLCYYEMFEGCTALRTITCLATDISATDCTFEWVNGVSADGIFTKAYEASQWTRGSNGVPIGWTVRDV